MLRIITIVNFLGVAVLAGLCAVQWIANSQLHQDNQHLDQTLRKQSAKMDEQGKTIKLDASSADDLRQQLSIADSANKQTLASLNAITAERDRLAAQRDQLGARIAQLNEDRDQLKSSIDTWKAAVAQRDDALKQASGQLQTAAAARDDAVSKYNDLANKYNDVVKELNSARAKP